MGTAKAGVAELAQQIDQMHSQQRHLDEMIKAHEAAEIATLRQHVEELQAQRTNIQVSAVLHGFCRCSSN